MWNEEDEMNAQERIRENALARGLSTCPKRLIRTRLHMLLERTPTQMRVCIRQLLESVGNNFMILNPFATEGLKMHHCLENMRPQH
jgi:hypothetical protein